MISNITTPPALLTPQLHSLPVHTWLISSFPVLPWHRTLPQTSLKLSLDGERLTSPAPLLAGNPAVSWGWQSPAALARTPGTPEPRIIPQLLLAEQPWGSWSGEVWLLQCSSHTEPHKSTNHPIYGSFSRAGGLTPALTPTNHSHCWSFPSLPWRSR